MFFYVYLEFERLLKDSVPYTYSQVTRKEHLPLVGELRNSLVSSLDRPDDGYFDFSSCLIG